MFGKIKKLSRGSKGMEALQAVLLIGVAFVVVWGLMAIWNGTAKQKVTDSVTQILDGKERAAGAKK